jgi:hypothetical protein
VRVREFLADVFCAALALGTLVNLVHQGAVRLLAERLLLDLAQAGSLCARCLGDCLLRSSAPLPTFVLNGSCQPSSAPGLSRCALADGGPQLVLILLREGRLQYVVLEVLGLLEDHVDHRHTHQEEQRRFAGGDRLADVLDELVVDADLAHAACDLGRRRANSKT